VVGTDLVYKILILLNLSPVESVVMLVERVDGIVDADKDYEQTVIRGPTDVAILDVEGPPLIIDLISKTQHSLSKR